MLRTSAEELNYLLKAAYDASLHSNKTDTSKVTAGVWKGLRMYGTSAIETQWYTNITRASQRMSMSIRMECHIL
jgi:hypothetical protein